MRRVPAQLGVQRQAGSMHLGSLLITDAQLLGIPGRLLVHQIQQQADHAALAEV